MLIKLLILLEPTQKLVRLSMFLLEKHLWQQLNHWLHLL